MPQYNLKEQIKQLNGSINYYEKKINNCKDKVKKFEDICKKYPDIEYYGGKIFYLPNPSLAKKITFVAGYLGNIDYKKSYTASRAGYSKYSYNASKFIYSYFLDEDLKIFCDKNAIFEQSGNKNGYKDEVLNFKINDYSKFFDESNCKDKLVKSSKKLLYKYIIELSKNYIINISDDSFDKEKIQGMLLFK